MLEDFAPLIPLSLVVPAVGAVFAAALGPRRGDLVRWVALATTLVTLVLVAVITIKFASDPPAVPEAPPNRPAWSRTFHPVMTTEHAILPLPPTRPDPDREPDREPPAIKFFVGLDGLNVWLVALTALLMVPSVLVSWKAITERVNEYYAWMLLLEVGLIGVFAAFDIVLFYVFFELTLVPLFFLIGIWGGPQRQHAARKFFIYTLAGSLIALLGVLGVVLACYTRANELTFSIPRLVEIVQERVDTASHNWSPADLDFWRSVQLYVFLALMAGFAVKVPLVPLHTWLPLAHVEAPTAGSVLLAGVLLKLGTYGFLRLALPLAPDTALSLGVPLIGSLAVAGVIYGALCSLAQDDIKKLVAYSSVSHLGICMLGMFALNKTGLGGSLVQMINHGLSTGALFLLVGMLYERYHTRLMADYGGMAAKLKLLGVWMVFICLSSAGLPGLNGFWGEVLSLMGIATVHKADPATGQVPTIGPMLTALGATGVVLGAWYLFTMLRRVFFGPLKEPHHEGPEPVRDLNGREWAALVPVGVLCLALGVFPQPFFNAADRDLQVVADIAEDARTRVKQKAAEITAVGDGANGVAAQAGEGVP
jgi:NADH-quinone oxidoreductase subunit M